MINRKFWATSVAPGIYCCGAQRGRTLFPASSVGQQVRVSSGAAEFGTEVSCTCAVLFPVVLGRSRGRGKEPFEEKDTDCDRGEIVSSPVDEDSQKRNGVIETHEVERSGH